MWLTEWKPSTFPHFMKKKIEIRLEIDIFVIVRQWKLKVILVPGLQRHHGCWTQLFEKMQCSYAEFQCLCILSCYGNWHLFSVNRTWKSSGCECGGLIHCVHRQKDNRIQTASLWNCKRIPSCPQQCVPVFHWPACDFILNYYVVFIQNLQFYVHRCTGTFSTYIKVHIKAFNNRVINSFAHM